MYHKVYTTVNMEITAVLPTAYEIYPDGGVGNGRSAHSLRNIPGGGVETAVSFIAYSEGR